MVSSDCRNLVQALVSFRLSSNPKSLSLLALTDLGIYGGLNILLSRGSSYFFYSRIFPKAVF